MTQCLGNTGHPFVATVLLFCPPCPALRRVLSPLSQLFSSWGTGGLPPTYSPPVWVSKVCTTGCHASTSYLRCRFLAEPITSPCCGRGFFISVAQQSSHARQGGRLAFVKMILAQNQKLLQLHIVRSPLSVPCPPEPASGAIPITRYYKQSKCL